MEINNLFYDEEIDQLATSSLVKLIDAVKVVDLSKKQKDELENVKAPNKPPVYFYKNLISKPIPKLVKPIKNQVVIE